VTFLLFSITNIRVHAQISKITHVIVVIQENRTPDNLFAADSVGAGAAISAPAARVAARNL
jgi:phospholipase C